MCALYTVGSLAMGHRAGRHWEIDCDSAIAEMEVGSVDHLLPPGVSMSPRTEA